MVGPVFGRDGPQNAPDLGALVSARAARSRRAQEPAADGSKAGLGGARPVAALHRQSGLGRRAAVDGAGAESRPAGGRLQRTPRDRRHGVAQEGHAVSGRRAPILRAVGQAGELPVAGVADARAGRGARARGPALVPARRVGGRRAALRPGRHPRSGCNRAQQGRDRALRVGSREGCRRAVRHGAGRRGLRHECRVPARPR